MDKQNKIIKDALNHWQPYYNTQLTEYDGFEINDNIVNFFHLLRNWKKRQEKEINNNDH